MSRRAASAALAVALGVSLALPWERDFVAVVTGDPASEAGRFTSFTDDHRSAFAAHWWLAALLAMAAVIALGSLLRPHLRRPGAVLAAAGAVVALAVLAIDDAIVALGAVQSVACAGALAVMLAVPQRS